MNITMGGESGMLGRYLRRSHRKIGRNSVENLPSLPTASRGAQVELGAVHYSLDLAIGIVGKGQLGFKIGYVSSIGSGSHTARETGFSICGGPRGSRRNGFKKQFHWSIL